MSAPVPAHFPFPLPFTEPEAPLCNVAPDSTTISGFQIGSIFIILACSLLGTALPILAKSSKRFQFPPYALFLGKSFGIGVILSVGFVHLMPSADQALTNPCSPEVFSQQFKAMSGVFALASVLIMQLIQLIAVMHFKPHSHGNESGGHDHAHNHHDDSDHHHNHSHTDIEQADIGSSADNIPVNKPNNSISVSLDLEKDDTKDYIASEQDMANAAIEVGVLALASDACCETKGAALLSHTGHHHARIVAWLLEFGISLHSVIVGLTLGVSSGSEFSTLLIALAFHQAFEGFALSATVIDSGFKSLSYPMLMACIYTLAAPIGVSIGLGIVAAGAFYHDSSSYLVVSGILTSISAGILIYDALVNLLTSNVTHNHSFLDMNAGRKAGILMFLWLGAILMSLLGLWV